MVDLTSTDIEILRATSVDGQETSTGQALIQCELLSKPPMSSELRDVFSPVLLDVFHRMWRPYVPTQCELPFQPPVPGDEIGDVYSPLLGDVFHALWRPSLRAPNRTEAYHKNSTVPENEAGVL